MATLTLPEIHSDPNGWGPLHDWQPESFNEFNIGYAPFSKLEKLGKAADWNNLGRTPARQNQGTSPFEEDEQGEFFVVDSRQTRTVKSGFTQRTGQNKARQRTRGGGHWQDQQQGRAKGRQQQQQRQGQRGGRGGQGGRRGGGYNAQQHQRKTATSVDIEPSWGEAVGVIDFNNLQSSYVEAVPTPETVSSYGSIKQYNNANDKLSVRQEKPLERGYAAEMKSYNLTASEDPVMKDLVEKKTANVYATDSVLVVLMSLLRSAYAFDVVVTKDESGNIFFDKRDDFLFDYISVNENSNEPPYDESDVAYNTVEALHKEATTANFNFSQQVLHKESDKQTKFDNPNPFVPTGENAPSVAYFYKTFDLGDDVKICVRTEIDSFEVVQIKNQTKPRNLLVKSLLEYDQKITGGWRVKLESQKAGCFATELKSNNCKLTKWLLQAHLAGVPHLKIGWVSRKTKEPYVHSVLAVTNHPVSELTSELGVDFTQVWGALKYIIMTLQKYSEGSYIILRDPTKKTVYIYKTLNDEFKRKK